MGAFIVIASIFATMAIMFWGASPKDNTPNEHDEHRPRAYQHYGHRGREYDGYPPPYIQEQMLWEEKEYRMREKEQNKGFYRGFFVALFVFFATSVAMMYLILNIIQK